MPAAPRLKALVIDDERPARLFIRQLAECHADVIDIIGEAANGKTAVKLIDEAAPDVIFLDINMPGMDGFEMLSKIRHRPFIIFTTAYEQYAIKAFETNSIDYLVKPIEEKRFAQSVAKLQRMHEAIHPQFDLTRFRDLFSELKENKAPTTIPVRIGEKIILLRHEDVVYLEAKEKYVFIVTSDGREHLSDTRLAEFETSLPPDFLRVQKSFVINKKRISEIHRHFGNRLIITMNDSKRTRIRTGGTYIDLIRKNLGL